MVRRRETTALKAYALTMTWGVPLNLIVGIPFIIHTVWSALSVAGWIGILYGSVLVQVIAMALYSYAVSRVSGSIAACYMGVQSITGELFAAQFSGETFAAYKAAGSLLIIIGLIVVTRFRIKIPQDTVLRLDGERYSLVGADNDAKRSGAWSSSAFTLDDEDDEEDEDFKL